MVHNAFLNPFDSTVYHIINGLAGHNHLVDDIMIFFAKYAIEIYVVFFFIAWIALPRKNIQNRHALVIAGFSGILALIINVVISHFWFRPRPFTVFPKGTFTELVAHSVDASFPSDHTAGSFGFAAGSWGQNTKGISYTFTLIAIIVMFSRVYVGVHYPTDVIGGMIVGIIASKVMWKFSRLIYPLTLLAAKLFKFGPTRKVSKRYRSM